MNIETKSEEKRGGWHLAGSNLLVVDSLMVWQTRTKITITQRIIIIRKKDIQCVQDSQSTSADELPHSSSFSLLYFMLPIIIHTLFYLACMNVIYQYCNIYVSTCGYIHPWSWPRDTNLVFVLTLI